jgi:putative ABC transport system ATP-binding protein
MKVIEMRGVTKSYHMGNTVVHALDGVDLEIGKEEFIIVMGPSGSGKSTLMNMIGCLDTPTEGHVFLDGVDISELSESELATIRGKKVGFVFQKFNLIPSLTAAENVSLPLSFQGVPRSEHRERAKKYLELVGLGDRIDHKPSELSGGQQQRVAVARSLVNEPDIILADEPTGNLDTKTGEHIMQLLKDLNKERGTTIIIVTHDVRLKDTGTRLIELQDGKIQ